MSKWARAGSGKRIFGASAAPKEDDAETLLVMNNNLLLPLEGIITLTCHSLWKGVDKKSEDQSQLLSALQWTELAGTVSMLYGMLLHQVPVL